MNSLLRHVPAGTWLRLLPILVVFLLALGFTSAYAQAQVDNNYIPLQSSGNFLDSFNWLLLLPVILIPAGFLLLRGLKTEEVKPTNKYNYVFYHDILTGSRISLRKTAERKFKIKKRS